ncbi:PH domain-containing protein [Virgibacillus sp. C22-A2]|uniref:PH domain-containing protein n=1 Tax=Virgibacillus tibetensis TaxID=3042313 RepID=A0ABU6KH98_9BACI|nr:PH domain-containing protein [Virgibacillus sp. C22-A2]
MSKQQRLHPAAILFNFVRVIKEALFAVVLGFITLRDGPLFYFILIGSIIILLLVIFSILSWYRFTYRVEGDELRIEYGIFIRKKRYISKNRIQSIDLTAGVIHRVFKLVQVQIETAGSGTRAEASLKAVRLAEGERLRSELKEVRKGSLSDEVHEGVLEESPEPFYQITFKRLFLAGSTSGSIGIILAFAVFGISELEQFIPKEFYDNTIQWVVGLSIIIIAGLLFIILIFLWLLGIAGTMIKYGNFTITKKTNDELFITRGLIEKKQITIPRKRIQAVGIRESVIRQPLGFVTLFAEVAGGSFDKGEDFSTVLFPIMKKGEVNDFLKELLPEYAEHVEEMTPIPRRGLKFYLFRATFPFILIGAGIAYFIPQYLWVPIVLLLGSSSIGFLRYQDAGFQIEGERLTVRYRILSKVTMFIYHKRLQAFEKEQNPIQKVQSLTTLRLSIVGVLGAGKHYVIKDLDDSKVVGLSEWYSYKTKNLV